MQPIFVSSTFRDMQVERDMLNFRVLPEISEYARRRGEAYTSAYCSDYQGIYLVKYKRDFVLELLRKRGTMQKQITRNRVR